MLKDRLSGVVVDVVLTFIVVVPYDVIQDYIFDEDDNDDDADGEGELVFIVGLIISPTTRLSRKFATPKQQKIGQNQNLVNWHNSFLTV